MTTIRIGDKMRSAGGVEGKVVLISDDRRSVTLQVPGEWPRGDRVSIPLIRLEAIDHYTDPSLESACP